MSIETYLTDSEKVYRRSLGAVNSYGEAAETWTLVATVLGTIQPRSETVGRDENGNSIVSDGTLYTLAQANIRDNDKIVDPNNKSWNVIAIMNESNKAHHYKILLRAIV